jgi:hypothetical protein
MRRRRLAQSTLVRVAAGEAGISGKDLQFNTGDGSEVRITPLSLSCAVVERVYWERLVIELS